MGEVEEGDNEKDIFAVPRQLLAELGVGRGSGGSGLLTTRRGGEGAEAGLQLQSLAADVPDREACQFAVIKVSRIVGFFRQQMLAATEAGRLAGDPTLQQLCGLADALEAEVRSATASAGAVTVALVDACSPPPLPPPPPWRAPVPPMYPSTPQPAAAQAPPSALLFAPPATPSRPSSPDRRDSSHSYEMLRESLRDAQRRCESLSAELQRQKQVSQELTASLCASRDAKARLEEQAKNAKDRLEEQARRHSEELTSLARQRRADAERMEDLEARRHLEENEREKEAQRRLASMREDADARSQQLLNEKLRAMLPRLNQVRRDLSCLRTDHEESRRAVCGLGQTARQMLRQAEWNIAQRLEAHVVQQLELRKSSMDAARDLEERATAEYETRVNDASSWSRRLALVVAERDDLQAQLAELAAVARAREAARVALEQERWVAEASTAELHGRLQESSQALSASLASGRETLREELEDQARRLAEAGEQALCATRVSYEQRLVYMQETHQQDSSHARCKLEAELCAVRCELAAERGRLEASANAAELRAAEFRGRAERDIAELRDSAERAVTRDSVEREAQRMQSAFLLEDRERLLGEATAEAATYRERASELRAQASELRAELDGASRQALQERRDALEERRRLENVIAREGSEARLLHDESQAQCQQWRESHLASLQQAQLLVRQVCDAQAQAQLQAEEATLAREKTQDRDKELLSTELSDFQQRLSESQARLDASERDLARTRQLLLESQAESARQRQDRERDEREGITAKHRLQAEVREASAALESAARSEAAAARAEATLSLQLDEARVRSRQDRERAKLEREELQQRSGEQVSEKDRCIELLRSECDARSRALESRHGAASPLRERADAWAIASSARLESEELLCRVAEHRWGGAAVDLSAVQAQLERQILQLQQHTGELLGDTQATAVSPDATASSPTAALFPPMGDGAGGRGASSSCWGSLPGSPRRGGALLAGTVPLVGQRAKLVMTAACPPEGQHRTSITQLMHKCGAPSAAGDGG